MASEPVRCVEPGVISGDDLIAYIHGEAPPLVAAHLRDCPSCRSEATSYGQMDGFLRSALFRVSCPDTMAIGEYVSELLPPERALEVAEHITGCPHCKTETESFRRFLSVADPVPQSNGVVSAVKRIFAQPVRLEAERGLRGLRGVDAEESTTYSATGLQLTLSVQRAGPGLRRRIIVGMLHAGAALPAQSHAELYAGDTLAQTEPIDEFGSFQFENVQPGNYRVEVTATEATVVVDAVAVT